MLNTLPVYELLIDGNESFVDAIALVESPAIEKEFLAFNEQKQYQFSLDEEKMELLGAAMIPDQLIYRRNDDGFEYNVFFSKDTIRNISQSFFKAGFQSNMNIEHSAVNADSYVFQSMIVDSSKGINLMDLPDGSWVVGVKVLNEKVWQDIKEGKRKGFSIEGVFELERKQFDKYEQEAIVLLEKIKNILSIHI